MIPKMSYYFDLRQKWQKLRLNKNSSTTFLQFSNLIIMDITFVEGFLLFWGKKNLKKHKNGPFVDRLVLHLLTLFVCVLVLYFIF